MPLPNPVIVVPGIIAVYLRDQYSIPPDTIWSVITKDYERAAMHPSNLVYEAAQPARVMPDQIFEVAYSELIEELRHNLSSTADRPVPVYPFGYDWRQPLHLIESQLRDFIDEVIERTKILKHYYEDGYNQANPQRLKVNLVGHSMGGLIITGYLQANSGAHKVAKIATLATPYKGSFESIVKLATGTADLGTSAPSSREREAARITPALYHLIPSCPTVQFTGVAPSTLFDSAAWQPSIVDSIREFVRLHAVNPNLPGLAEKIFQELLDQARQHRQRLDSFRLPTANLAAADWLCVIGVDSTTRVHLQITDTGGGPEFEFHSLVDRANNWSPNNTSQQRRLTGDGTVPFEGALPSFLGEENIVCVTPNDYGYWEVGDRALTALAGFHGILPNMDLLHRMIVAHFTGAAPAKPNIWGRRVPGVQHWAPPIPNLPEKVP